ncbi:MAG: phosphoribosylamine--glycine ligase [Euryarchaeota archaeon]|nr:phosphoribosylamine--glycine ligase [Euryarchaeota archaeon]MBT86200.1 phosphoribosylamine--glycine ligase [Euryarchaeota archaeon]DAC46349.1 MAG TPA: phosphoribosylamine--glycine ligase [Candidatus Poseidoniales archaeon]HII34054.1 phosphoribosylamine--glycine ligase [Candidatus Thalassarchaeaceae archaeon]|tara:strand:- start:844 stop:2121 length:1278 start_codon:yes stop_codon:yes gene_type:complete
MEGLTVLIVGSGGREHALSIGLEKSHSVESIHAAPGNAGTAMIGTNHPIEASDIEGLVNLAREISADLVVIGPEGPLVGGISDRLREMSIPCFGPHSEGAMLEGSKTHAKRLMKKLHIPTGDMARLDANSDVVGFLEQNPPPWVVKRDVLAAGKGVVVTSEMAEAERFIEDSIEKDGFVIVEEFLEGEEASLLVIMDESGYVCLPPSQDHKRAWNGDKGPNTGGMGAYAPAPLVTPSVHSRVLEEIVEPMHHYLRNQSQPYRGVLYVGLMVDSDGSPSVVEFNVRFGDPETQVTIPLIESDLGELLLAAAEGNLSSLDPVFSGLSSATVVLASEGYPVSSNAGREIFGSDVIIDEGLSRGYVNFAGARIQDGVLISSGGRVLAATGIAPELAQAVDVAYQIIESISLEGSHFRTDIGHRALPHKD